MARLGDTNIDVAKKHGPSDSAAKLIRHYFAIFMARLYSSIVFYFSASSWLVNGLLYICNILLIKK